MILQIWLIVSFSQFFCWGEKTDMAEKRMVTKLLDAYKKTGIDGRPVDDPLKPVNVSIRFSLIKINKIKFEEQEIDIVGWINLAWEDPLMKWDKSEASGIDKITVPHSAIWKPDIVLFNAASPTKLIHDAHIVVDQNGRCTWVPQYRIEAICEDIIDEEKPVCGLKFGSWAYHSGQLKLGQSRDRIDASFYTPHKDYELFSSSATVNERSYKCCPDVKYGDITYEIVLKARPKPEAQNQPTDSSSNLKMNMALLIGALFIISKAKN